MPRLRLTGVKGETATPSLSTSKIRLQLRWRKMRALARSSAARTLSRRVGATLRRTAGRGALILTYHRIDQLRSDPQMLSTSPAHFGEQLEVMRKHFNVISLDQLTARLVAGDELANTLAITIDDGYADNLICARPLLERHDVPATVFIASDYIGGRSGFWWDELEEIVLQSTWLPQKLRLCIAGRELDWNLSPDAFYEPGRHELDQSWHDALGTAPSRRHELYRALHDLLYGLPPAQRESALEKLRVWAGQDRIAQPNNRALTCEELAALAASPLVEIGAHTATHPALSMLSPREQEAEISHGKARLEEMTGAKARHFAYPYGSLSSFNDESIALVKQAEFRSACTTFADSVRPGCDLFQLPRVLVRDWNGDEFQHRLTGLFRH